MRNIGRSRTVNTKRLRIFIGIATALWLVGAIAAVMDRDTQMIVTWFCFVAFGALIVGGLTHRSQWRAYRVIALFVVAVAISMGLFIGGVAYLAIALFVVVVAISMGLFMAR